MVEGKGRGIAHFIIDYGPEFDIVWGVCIEATGEWWWPSNWDVRGCPNWTLAADRKTPATG